MTRVQTPISRTAFHSTSAEHGGVWQRTNAGMRHGTSLLGALAHPVELVFNLPRDNGTPGTESIPSVCVCVCI